jgi:hypothetical protein
MHIGSLIHRNVRLFLLLDSYTIITREIHCVILCGFYYTDDLFRISIYALVLIVIGVKRRKFLLQHVTMCERAHLLFSSGSMSYWTLAPHNRVGTIIFKSFWMKLKYKKKKLLSSQRLSYIGFRFFQGWKLILFILKFNQGVIYFDYPKVWLSRIING